MAKERHVLVVEKNGYDFTVVNALPTKKAAKEHVERLKAKEDSRYFAERELLVFEVTEDDVVA